MKLKSIAAILVAAIMVVSVPMVAMADTHKHGGVDVSAHDEITGDIAGGVVVKGNITCKINGDVTSTGDTPAVWTDNGATVEAKHIEAADYTAINSRGGSTIYADSVLSNGSEISDHGIFAMGEGTQIHVSQYSNSANGSGISAALKAYVEVGSAKGKNYGLQAQIGANVKVEGKVECTGTQEGDTGIAAYSGATVTAGSVEAIRTGVSATGTGTTVDVTGLVKLAGTNITDAGINASKGATVTAGSVESNKGGVKVSGNASVVVYGDVEGAAAIFFENSGVGNEGGTVTVLGTVDGVAYDVVVEDTEDKTYSLFAYEIKDGLDCWDRSGGSDSAIKDQVFYIVKTSGVGDIASLTDKNNNQYTTSVDGKTYYGVKSSDAKGTEIRPTAKEISEGNGYIVRVTEVPGYKFKSMTSANGILTDNGDGTYTLIVPEGGGVTLDLVYEAIRRAGASFTSTPTSIGSASAPLTGGTWTNVNGVWTYTNNGEKLINTTAWIQYTNAQGQVVTAKFCFDNNGNMITNAWKQTADGTWNYFGADGAMLVNTTTPDGYVVDANGNWVKAQ